MTIVLTVHVCCCNLELQLKLELELGNHMIPIIQLHVGIQDDDDECFKSSSKMNYRPVFNMTEV